MPSGRRWQPLYTGRRRVYPAPIWRLSGGPAYLPPNIAGALWQMGGVPTRVLLAVLFYALLMSALIVHRPAALFDSRGPVPFGAGRGRTVFDLGAVAAASAVLSSALFTLVDVAVPPPPP